METKKIKNIIFDLGNTLIFFDFWYFYDGLSRLEKNLNLKKFVKFISEKKLDTKLATGKLRHKDFFKILKKKFELKIGYKDFIFLYSDIFWENSPMLKIFEKLVYEDKYKLILLSNTDSAHFNFITKNFPVISNFRFKILSYKVSMMKPQSKIFNYVINKYQLDPEETLLIDDMKDNIISASKIGLHSIHYRSHKKFQKDFKKFLSAE
ncbi:MAG TPA: HAD-IA family hydrolase [Ignavibacteria bacterium]|nr:HAD-IA family hydrolase [Ignavibacteria bacterium]